MRIEAVVFDIGDVLEVNPRTGWPARWAARLALDPAAFDRSLGALWAPGSVGEASLEEIEQRTAVAFGVDSATVASLMEDMWAEYVGTLNGELCDYFRRLRPRYRTGILSNSFVGAREREERLYRFSELCDEIVYSHEEGAAKPDPRIYHAVCDRLRVAPAATLFLDDVQENVDGAIAVGMRAIRFRDTAQAIAELDALLAA